MRYQTRKHILCPTHWWKGCSASSVWLRLFIVIRGGILNPSCLLPCVNSLACKKHAQHQGDGNIERLNRTLAQQLAILTADHQRDWGTHLPFILMAYRLAVHDSTLCTPALLMLGRELRTPPELLFGKPPDSPAVPAGPEYARQLQDRMETAHAFARDQLGKAGVRQKRNYNVRSKGRNFETGESVWVYSPTKKRGHSPKLDCHWVGPCLVLERVG